MQSEKLDFIQNPTAKLIDIGDGNSVLVLDDWNVEDERAGYTRDEVQTLINILQESLNLMDRYSKANESLPLFEQGDANVQQEIPRSIGTVG
jgi:hypothetical protein